MSRVLVAIQGDSPLLMNRFTDETASKVSAGTTPLTIGGRGTPREQATPKLYLAGDGRPMIPGPNIYRALVDAGVFAKVGRRALTTAKSSLIPSGIHLKETECPVENPLGATSPVTWEVDSRSVVIPATGGRIMMHRPRFDTWRLNFTLIVDDEMFDERLVRRLIDDAGKKIGLGDYRPSRKGPFGRFLVAHWVWYREQVPSTSDHEVPSLS